MRLDYNFGGIIIVGAKMYTNTIYSFYITINILSNYEIHI